MISAMRTLALDYLFNKLGSKDNPPPDMEEWYYKIRTDHLELLFPFLVESGENIEKIYILEKDIDQNTIKLYSEDMTEEKSRWLPFMRPSGSQGAQIGPVIKRSFSKATGPGPSAKILRTTMKSFEEIARDDKPWSLYFNEIVELLKRKLLKLPDQSVIDWKKAGYENILISAVNKIEEEKQTVFLAVKDNDRKLPGQRQEYLTYLMNEKLVGTKYVTGNTPAVNNQTCPLCGASSVTVFPNALKGAGINISNADRAGAFPGINTNQAWKRYALCNACADLLYIYKFHFLKKDSKNRNSFITPIAGENAVVIPFATVDCHARQGIWRAVKDFVKTASSDVEEVEMTILDILKNKKGILNLTFLWATTGQNVEDITGMITNVPLTRLVQLSKLNDELKDRKHPVFPTTLMLHPDLSLRALKALFDRPGGRKAKDTNASMKLRQMKRIIAASVYYKTKIPTARFWEEVITTARWHWLYAIEKGSADGLLNEGKKQTGEPYLTAASWTRHLCWWLYYFNRLEVIEMERNFYEPHLASLKPFFGPESGIDSPQKAYAFLLGVLYGKVLQVQGARRVNVSANALTWLKRLTLKGRDLPGLYIKIREKLLAYETERNEDVRELIKEIGMVGVQLGDTIELDEIPTNYYLLLGQSLTTTIL
jgi:CRISPR-associated protein Csh1